MSCISIVDTLFVRTGLLLCAACKARAFLLVGEEEEEEEEEAATPPSTGARSLVLGCLSIAVGVLWCC
jgi:hypothetical protein